jgi:hypothetical protein
MKNKSVFFLLVFSAVALAAEMKGVKMPDQIQVGGKSLVLNGLGMRMATMFKVNVYVGALYSEKKTSDAGSLLASSDLKRVEMAFVRGVGAGKIRDAWDDCLKENCSSTPAMNCDRFKAPFNELKTKIVDMNDGDHMAFDIYPNKVDVWMKGSAAGSIQADGFSTQLLKCWLGHPPNDELKKGMLGL